TRGTPGGGAPRGPRDCRQRSAENRASHTTVEKTLRGKVGKQTFPLRLGIPQKTRDSHFPTAATTTALRLHFKWRDDPPHGYILKWLDAGSPGLVSPQNENVRFVQSRNVRFSRGREAQWNRSGSG